MKDIDTFTAVGCAMVILSASLRFGFFALIVWALWKYVHS
jgi:hypothetical protein